MLEVDRLISWLINWHTEHVFSLWVMAEFGSNNNWRSVHQSKLPSIFILFFSTRYSVPDLYDFVFDAQGSKCIYLFKHLLLWLRHSVQQFLIEPKTIHFQDCWLFFCRWAGVSALLCYKILWWYRPLKILYPPKSSVCWLIIYPSLPLPIDMDIKLGFFLHAKHLTMTNMSMYTPPSILYVLFHFIPNISCRLGMWSQHRPFGKQTNKKMRTEQNGHFPGNILKLIVSHAMAYHSFENIN